MSDPEWSLPRTNIYFRCAVCGERVGRQLANWRFEASKYQAPCSKHGPLSYPPPREVREIWTRRGQPESLNLRLSPV